MNTTDLARAAVTGWGGQQSRVARQRRPSRGECL